MTSAGQEVVLLVVVLVFAWNLGAHYTGATVGMPYASRSISLWPALAIVAVFSLLGATVASGKVEQTVGLHLISERHVSATLAIVIVACAGALTAGFNYLRLPTSTIQTLVFCVIGAAIAAGLSIHWSTLAKLAIVWVAAPIASALLGFVFTRAVDRAVPPDAAAEQARRQLENPPGLSTRAHERWAAWFPGVALGLRAEVENEASRERPQRSWLTRVSLRLLPAALIFVGVCASFVMGSNDVANATSALLLVRLFSTHAAGAIGGAGLFLGALT